MTHVLITGAQGFIGKTLVDQVLSVGIEGQQIERLTLVDIHGSDEKTQAKSSDPRIHWIRGSIADPAVMQACTAGPIDVAFHLASVPGGAAEQNYTLGRQVNLDATLHLIEALGRQSKPAHLVYASSIAVYGELLSPLIEGQTVPSPALSYGAHKLVCEALLADATRKGWLKGCALRLPGVVARPGSGEGLMSAFMSQIFWQLRDRKPIQIPVHPEGKVWWISAQTCADNLRHASTLSADQLEARGTYQMPALHLSVSEVVRGVARSLNLDPSELVSYDPVEQIDRLFARYPELHTPFALDAGFCHDGDVDNLVVRALSSPTESS